MAKAKPPNEALLNWGDVKELHDWTGILLGNGASMVLWDKFKYKSLYDTACSTTLAHPLSKLDKALFNEFETTNFELILENLGTAIRIGKLLEVGTTSFETRYESIKAALIDAVHAVHIPWAELTAAASTDLLETVRDTLSQYSYVYSTNYDLLVYWALMAKNGAGFKDYFWNGAFNIANTDIWDTCTKVLYLHGGLHLYRRPDGNTIKRSAEGGFNLLDLFGRRFGDAEPLFISEGTSEDKLSSIYRSDYLAFAYNEFINHKEPLVVFGHNLAASDEHLSKAIRRWGKMPIAVSIRPSDAQSIIKRKQDLSLKFPEAQLIYFDSTTHPLGSPKLNVACLPIK